jgi:hypothetical protein
MSVIITFKNNISVSHSKYSHKAFQWFNTLVFHLTNKFLWIISIYLNDKTLRNKVDSDFYYVYKKNLCEIIKPKCVELILK